MKCFFLSLLFLVACQSTKNYQEDHFTIANSRYPEYHQSSQSKKVLLSTTSFFCSIPYSSGKFCYAVGGSLVGASVYILTFGQADELVKDIVIPSVNGDWFVHPTVFTDNKPLHFIGSEDEGHCKEGQKFITVP